MRLHAGFFLARSPPGRYNDFIPLHFKEEERFDMLVTYEGHTPLVHPAARVAENATLSGAVKVDAGANIWYGAVVRGDEAPVSIGRETNVQDNAVIHASLGCPAAVGSRVTVGHSAVVHGCTVEDGCLVGMGSILLDGCVIGAHSLIGAGALVT